MENCQCPRCCCSEPIDDDKKQTYCHLTRISFQYKTTDEKIDLYLIEGKKKKKS